MNWLVLGILCAGLLYILADTTEPEAPKIEEDADHTVTYRNRSVGMCKMPELEEEQMN